MSRGECREVGIDGWVILGVGCVVDIVVVLWCGIRGHLMVVT